MKYLVLLSLMLSGISYGVETLRSKMTEYSKCGPENDRDYDSYVENTLESNENIRYNCFYIIDEHFINIFFNINSNGRATDIHAFPKEVDTSCAVNFIRDLKFTAPTSEFCGRFMIVNGAGG